MASPVTKLTNLQLKTKDSSLFGWMFFFLNFEVFLPLSPAIQHLISWVPAVSWGETNFQGWNRGLAITTDRSEESFEPMTIKWPTTSSIPPHRPVGANGCGEANKRGKDISFKYKQKISRKSPKYLPATQVYNYRSKGCPNPTSRCWHKRERL